DISAPSFREISGPTPAPAPDIAPDTAAGRDYIDLSPEEPNRSVSSPPRTGYDLDRQNYHVGLQDFGNKPPESRQCMSLEIRELKDVCINQYGFEVQEWQIPAVDSHMELNRRVLQSPNFQFCVQSHQNEGRERPPTVKWSGFQNALEESSSDVLILLDCCASGLSNTEEGNGVTELLAACAFNSIANGVGPTSFTHALISQLRKLARMPALTVGYLYNLIFAEIQGLQIEDPQRKKAPIHLVLTQDHRLPRSIRISARPRIPVMNRPSLSAGRPLSGNACKRDTGSLPQDFASSQSSGRSSGVFSPGSNDGASSSSSFSQLPKYPRLLFSIHISEDIKPNELSPKLFADWLATLPLSTSSVSVEAGFASDSTLLMVSMPVAFLEYLPDDNPAITMLGVIRSKNILSTIGDQRPILPHMIGNKADDAFDDQATTQDSGFEEPSMSYDNFEYTSPQGLERQAGASARVGAPSRCHSCNQAESPEWTRGSEGDRTLCNACGIHYAKTGHKVAHKQVLKPSSPLRHSMSMPAAAVSSPTARKTLFHTEETKASTQQDRISLLEKELKEKETLIGQLRDDNARLEKSKTALPDKCVDRTSSTSL
ncbi:GATA zinc finger domain-containing protein, partial [Lachnellula occidentalis]